MFNDQYHITFFQSEIEKMRELEYNWDGYQSIAPLNSIIDKSINFINNIELSNINKRLKGDVYPNPNGTISFEFVGELINSKLVLEIGKNNYSFFYEDDKKENPIFVNGSDVIDNIEFIKKFLRSII